MRIVSEEILYQCFQIHFVCPTAGWRRDMDCVSLVCLAVCVTCLAVQCAVIAGAGPEDLVAGLLLILCLPVSLVLELVWLIVCAVSRLRKTRGAVQRSERCFDGLQATRLRACARSGRQCSGPSVVEYVILPASSVAMASRSSSGKGSRRDG